MSLTGDRIRELRKQNHLTLDDVARHLGVGRQAIYKYEHGTVTNIPLENLEKMAELFGTTPGYLAGWPEDESEVSEADRRALVIPDSEIFRKILINMDPIDYEIMMDILERTEIKLRQLGKL